MHALLKPTFSHLESQREEFTGWMRNAEEIKVHQKPAPDKWSAAQLLYHIVEVDQLVLKTLEKRMSSSKPLRPKRLSTSVRSMLLNLFLKLPIKFKAPEAVRHVPEEVLVPQVLQQWADTRAKMHAFLSSFPEEHYAKEVFFHPRSGMITLPQTLSFLVEHTVHHRGQLKNLLK